MANTILNFKLIGFEVTDKANFESIFSLAEARFQARWRIVEMEEEVDFYLFFEKLDDLNKQTHSLKPLPLSRYIFYVTTETEQGNELLVSDNHLPSMRSLILLFNHLSSTLEAVSSEPVHFEPSPVIEQVSMPIWQQMKEGKIQFQKEDKHQLQPETNFYDPDASFLTFLLSTESLIYIFNINDAENNRLYIDLANKVYYSQQSLQYLKSFVRQRLELFSPDSLSVAELEAIVTRDGLKAIPLNNLIWYVTFSCSLGRLFKGADKEAFIHLKRWPNMNFPDCHQFIKLAAYMHSNSVNLETIQQDTGFSLEQIYNFYNACQAIGLIEYTQVMELSQKNANKSQLLSKISSRLKQVS